MHHNYIIFLRSPSRHKHACFWSCCFRTSQKWLVFGPQNRQPDATLLFGSLSFLTWQLCFGPGSLHNNTRVGLGGPLSNINPASSGRSERKRIIWRQRPHRAQNMKAPRLRKAIKTQPLPSPHCAASPPPVWRLTDGEIWKWFGQRLPNHPPQEQRAVDAVCWHLCGYMSRRSFASISELRGSPSRLRRASGAGLWSEMLPRRAAGASPCFYCLEDRKETEISLCWRKGELQLRPKCMMGNHPLWYNYIWMMMIRGTNKK